MVLAGLLLILLMRLVGLPLAQRLPQALSQAYRRLYEGTVGSFRRLPSTASLSVGAWLLEAGRLLLVVHALGLSVPLPLVLFVALTSALLTTVPVTPGGLGLVELGVSGLLMLAVPKEAAVAAALVDRSISYLSIVLVGGVLFLLHQLRRPPRPSLAPGPGDEPRPS